VTLLVFPGLSVRQPWAELIVSGKKPIEIRRWRTDYRGRIWIHAPQHSDEVLDQRFGLGDLFRGGYIGSAELTSIERIDERRWEAWRAQHLDPGPFQHDLFAWVLAYPRRLKRPVAAPGALGLFRIPEEILNEVAEADQAASSC
jgi:ASCH domain